jgi:hypothetical protein
VCGRSFSCAREAHRRPPSFVLASLAPFSPNLPPPPSRYREKDFAERLYRDERQSQGKFGKLASEKMKRDLSGCSFQPKIKRSTSAPKTRPSWADSDLPVSDRLYGYNNKINAKKAVLVEEAEAQLQRETPFKPNLSASIYNKMNNYGSTSASSAAGGDPNQFFERLSQKGGAQEKTAKREALLREERKQVGRQASERASVQHLVSCERAPPTRHPLRASPPNTSSRASEHP